MRSLDRRAANTCASSLPLSSPPWPIADSRAASISGVTSRPRSPVSLKSSSVVIRVMLAAGRSPRAASTASPLASSTPPMQNPSVFTWSARVIARDTSIALITPSAR